MFKFILSVAALAVAVALYYLVGLSSFIVIAVTFLCIGIHVMTWGKTPAHVPPSADVKVNSHNTILPWVLVALVLVWLVANLVTHLN